jgi:hypothetical protein
MVPKSQAPSLALKYFRKFSSDGSVLQTHEILKFQRFLDKIFDRDFPYLKPRSVFKTLELDDDGCANMDDFELWVMLYMTYDDEIDLLIHKQLLTAQALQK